MKRVNSEGRDVFRPKGQLAKEIDLATRAPRQVVEILSKRLSQERRQNIDKVVAHRTRRLTVAIEGVRDPHNTAAVIRTADAFGLQVVHVIERGDRLLSSRKVTQGAHKWVDLGVFKSADSFASVVRDEGKKILVATAQGTTPLTKIDPSEPMALVFGNEHEGVSNEMLGLSDATFYIPMFGFSRSINVSTAAAITLAYLRDGGKGDLSKPEARVLRARLYLRAVRAGYDIVLRELGS